MSAQPFREGMVEAGLRDKMEIIRCKPEGREVEPHRYETDSDALVEYFSAKSSRKVISEHAISRRTKPCLTNQ
jgi:hypothetical protein